MSFRANNPTNDGPAQHAGTVLGRANASAPAFTPQVMRSVRMRPLLAGLVAALVFFGLVGFALLQKPLYSVESVIHLEPMTPKLVDDPTPAVFDSSRYEAFIGEQTLLMQRMDVLRAAINTLPRPTWSMLGSTQQAAVNTLQGQLKVQRAPTGYQVSIGLKGTDPKKTADIVNAVAASYMNAVHKATAEESDVRTQLLAEERQRIEGALRSARAEQTALGASIGVANPTGESGNPYDAELSGIRTQLMEARAAHDVAAAQLASISAAGAGTGRTSGLAAAADDLMAGDPGLSTTRANIAGRKATLSAQMAGLTPANPVYKQDQDEMADLDRTLDAAAAEARGRSERRLQEKLKSDLDRTGDIEARLNGELSRQILTATSAGPKLQRASEVAADIQRLDIRQTAVDDTLRALRIAEVGPGQVRVSLAASPPQSPDANRTKLLLLAALPLALLLAAIAAVLARRYDSRLYGPVDLEEVLGFPPMAVLPLRSDVADRVFDEYVLRLAAGVESAYRTGGARTFLLTAVSLTTDIHPLAAALARKFEDIGVNVVVATASEMLAAPEEQNHAAELARPAELSRDGFVAANMARMKSAHALVLIEAEALLNSGQTEYVARCTDATILMIESGVTTREELLRAAALLDRLNVTGIGAVLEGLRLQFADGAFRAAVSAVERRQESRYQGPLVTTEPIDLKQVEEVEPAHAEELPQMQTVEAAVAEPIVPAAAIEPVVEESAPEFFETPTIVTEVSGRPMLVDHEVPHVDVYEEPLVAFANGTTHENTASAVSGRRLAAEPVDDATISPKSSWLDRLLRRDADPSFRIVPDEHDDEPAKAAAPRLSRRGDVKAEYDLPLANRLDQISRGRPAMQGTAYNNGTRGSRLQIVPQEAPAEVLVPQSERLTGRLQSYLPESIESLLQQLNAVGAEPIAEIVDAGHAVPAPWWSEPLEEEPATALTEVELPALATTPEPEIVTGALKIPAAVVTVAETPKPTTVRGPRRPFSFQELAAGVPQEVVPVLESAAEPEVVERIPQLEIEQPANEKFSVSPMLVAEPEAVPVPEPVHVDGMYDDVEPIYQAASRYLMTGRWDPIPPLRPTENGWRDGASENGYRNRPAVLQEESAAAPRLVSLVTEQTASAASAETEPLLSRQWGLLSKFQQARQSSGGRPVAVTTDENELLREAVNGGKRQR